MQLREAEMQIQSRTPKLNEMSFDGALMWFAEMQNADLLFHPEDDPADIIRIADGKPMFTTPEITELRFLLEEMDAHIGHEKVTEAAYPIFMNAVGIQLDA